MSSHAERPSFPRYFATGCIVVLAAALVTHALEDSWFFRHMENSNLDTWVAAKAPAVSRDVFVVSITDADYKGLFNAASPLRQDVVQQIVNAIAASGPKIVGVDLDTAEWDMEHAAALPKTVPIVWAREAAEEGAALEQVLGGAGDGACFGLPAYIPDDDGVIRRHKPFFEQHVSFARRLAAGCTEERAEPGGHEEEGELINFQGDRRAFEHLSSTALLTLAQTPEWRSNNPLKGKIVLLGGAFKAARDKFYTPVGRMDGVDILAHTVQTELPGGGVRRPGGAFFFALDLGLGLTLVAAAWFLPRRWSLPVVFLGVPAIAFAASWAAFQSLGYFASFVPVLGGVMIHELIEHMMEHRHLLHERAALARERDALLRELAAIKHY